MLAKMKAKAGSAAAFAKDKAEEHKVAERAALASKKAKDKVSESKAGKKALAAGAAVGGAAATVVANHMTPELREMLDHPERGVEVLRANPMVLFSALSIMRLLRSPSLIMLEAAMGLGMVLHAPTWQASIPELVPREQLTSAVALGSISFNLARAAGPAIGGFLVAWMGSWSAFAVNAGSFAGVIGVLLCWRRQEPIPSNSRSFLHSLWEGVRFVTADVTMRHILLRVPLFVIPASALWSLLPLVAHELLQWDAMGYGLLVGGIGLGAVMAAAWMPHARYRLGIAGTLTIAHGLMGLALASIALQFGRPATLLVMLISGSGWMMALTTLNSAAQMQLPRLLRARGMSCYLTAFAGSMAGGAMIWGAIARWSSIPTALFAAAGLVVISSIAGRLLPIHLND